MSSINYDLSKIKAVIFDIDGVFSPSTIPISETAEPVRMFNVKDRYAIRKAINDNIIIGVISAANSNSIRNFLLSLGIHNENLILNSTNKGQDLDKLLLALSLQSSEICYIGDDIPDLEPIKKVGLAICPFDAANEIKENSLYISKSLGGYGVIRDVLEQILKARGCWQ